MKLKYLFKTRFNDMLAGLFCLLLFLFFYLTISNGMGRLDESFYLAVAQRFAKGDRPLVDEWQISQLSDIFLVPVYSYFKSISGGTDGIILFMRLFFLALNFIYYWILYLLLRQYGIWGVISTVFFCAYVPWAMFAVNYYSMTPRFLMLICALAFLRKKEPSLYVFLLIGVLLSIAVIVEPPLSFLYVLYTCSVLYFEARRKKNPDYSNDLAFFFNIKSWLFITVSVIVCSAVFLVFLNNKSDLKNIISSINGLLMDPEYDFSVNGNVKSFFWSKIPRVTKVFGFVNIFLMLFVLSIALINRLSKNCHLKHCLALASVILPVLFYGYVFFSFVFLKAEKWYFFSVSPVPFYTFGLINYSLCNNKNKRMLIILLISILSSILMDSFSDVSFGICGIISVVPSFICFGQVLKELKQEQQISLEAIRRYKLKKRGHNNRIILFRTVRIKRFFCIAINISFLVFLLLECINIYYEGTFLLYEGKLNNEKVSLVEINDGPYRGIYTDHENYKSYYRVLSDLNQIKDRCQGSVYLFNVNPFAFLYLDLPSSNCSSWYSFSDFERQLLYFKTHPEKKPDMLYFLLYDGIDKDEINLLQQYIDLMCEGTVTNGEMGWIVDVKKWKDLSDDEISQWIKDMKTTH